MAEPVSEIERIRGEHGPISDNTWQCKCGRALEWCDAALLLAEVDRLREAAHNANGELLMHQDSCHGCRESVLALAAVGIVDEDAALSGSAKPKCRVCETQKAGLPTPGYTHDEMCERSGSAKEPR